jgi:hypothetical protein
MRKLYLGIVLLFTLLPLLGTVASVSASTNIGLLRVSNFLCPREVVPGATFPVSLDVEYAIQTLPDEATIRGAVYDGGINASSPLWQSAPTSVSNGGDQVWNFTLNAPAAEGFLNLTAYAFFLDNGTWSYFNNPVNGPGVIQRTVKIGRIANLEVNIGAPDIAVAVDGTTEQTSAHGDAVFSVAVSSNPTVSVPPMVELQNSTRIIFTEWSDGVTESQRQVLIDGDIGLTAQYRVQYLLTLTNSSTTQQWYDRGANVTLSAPATTLAPWPLNIFGVTETFHGWSGDIQSSSRYVNVTMDSPKTITAQMTPDYGPLALPTILAAGIAIAVITFAFVQGRPRETHENLKASAVEEPAPQSNEICPSCGKATQPEWTHCIKCGAKLRD